jgi:manganese/zinc/iron transport system permease protein
MNLLHDILFDYTLRSVTLGCMILGTVSGVLGSFAVLRKQGLMGDALSHSALPGICVVYMLTGEKTPILLMAGAGLACMIAAWLIIKLVDNLGIDSGTSLATILTVFFGGGTVLLSVIQRGASANKAGLDKFLFGQAASLTMDQAGAMAAVGGFALIVVFFLFKEFKVISFDPLYARSIGINDQRLGALLTGLLVLAIVIGLNTVGVILMSAMIIAPGAAARQWTDKLNKMLLIAAAIGSGCGLAGAIISIQVEGVPTGPAIVLCLAAVSAISVLFGTARGYVWTQKRRAARLAS